MKILIAAPIRQSEEVFRLYLKSLDELEKPGNVQIDRCFVFHNCFDLRKCCNQTDIVFNFMSNNAFSVDNVTHRWTSGSMSDVASMKNHIVKYAISNEYDYIFWVDSDLILDPKTLTHLVSLGKDIVAEIFWTAWQPDTPAGPNCWNCDQYTIYDGEIEKWKQPGVYEIGGTGACILVSTNIYVAGASYDPISNISYWGEDRNFCIRAAVAGAHIFVDTTYPAMHLYRTSDIEAYIQKSQTKNVLNSKEYWDNRHTDGTPDEWGKRGAKQTEDYSNMLIYGMPESIWSWFANNECTILDYGGAQGQLCHIWEEDLSKNTLTGYDISGVALKKARENYPDIEFVNDISRRKWDAVVCSNVLEHVKDWKACFNGLLGHAAKYVIVLVPYMEPATGEHIIEFNDFSFPLACQGFEKIYQKAILDGPNLEMNGKQLMVIYEKIEVKHKLALGMIVHNESDKYLCEVIDNSWTFCDEIFVLDDHSTDDTLAICKQLGCKVKNAENEWAVEWRLRGELIDWMKSESESTWFLLMDADDLLDIAFVEESRQIMDNDKFDVAFIQIFDCWNDRQTYRKDAYFAPYYSPRMMRASTLSNPYEWQKTVKHCLSIPRSIIQDAKEQDRVFFGKTVDKHFGWLTAVDRQNKIDRIKKDDPNCEIWGQEIRREILNDNPEGLFKFNQP